MMYCMSCSAGYLTTTGSFIVVEKNQWQEIKICSYCGSQRFYAKQGEHMAKYTGVLDAQQSNVDFSEKMKAYTKESFPKPFCQTCARFDHDAGGVQELSVYQANLKELRTSDIVERNSRSPNLGKKIGLFKKYACPRGHKSVIEISGSNYDELVKREAVKGAK